MTQLNRLDGGLIDRSTPLGFTFDLSLIHI